MALGKWIGGALGFISGGPLGALLGLALGALFDRSVKSSASAQSSSSQSGFTSEDNYRQQTYEEQRNSFLFSLLVMAAYIIKADNRVMHSEMEAVRRFLRDNFGQEAEQQGNDILLRLFEKQKHLDAQQPGSFRHIVGQCCQQIADNMEYSQRLQLFNFLVMIARADGNVDPSEVEALRFVGMGMQMSLQDVESMLNLRSNYQESLDSAYKVLGITKDATDDEVKTAYRRMALKHHPDRVAALGEDIRKAAEVKFQEINDAKERIYKARGL